MIIHSFGIKIKNFIRVKISLFLPSKRKTYSNKKSKHINNGKVNYYYEDGRLKAECSYKNGKLNGVSIHYYPNGNLKAKENYKNDKLDGLIKLYSENGELLKEEFYKNGILVLTQDI